MILIKLGTIWQNLGSKGLNLGTGVLNWSSGGLNLGLRVRFYRTKFNKTRLNLFLRAKLICRVIYS